MTINYIHSKHTANFVQRILVLHELLNSLLNWVYVPSLPIDFLLGLITAGQTRI